MVVKIKSLVKTFWLPVLLSSVLVIFQGLSYYLAKMTPLEAVVVGSRIDNLIPFLPFWVIFYVLWHPLLVLVPCYIYKMSKQEFYSYIVINFIIEVVAFFIFVFFPTIMERPTFIVNDIFTWLLNIVYMNDTPAMNCLPSMHCTVCFTSIYVILKSNKIPKKCKVLSTIIFILIVFSTMFVKQHAVMDVIAALILTLVVSLLVCKFKLDKKMENKVEKKLLIRNQK